jgi:hypothetical protein
VKLLVGVLGLIAAFAAAALWQSRWHAEAEAEREALRSGSASSIELVPEGAEPGWGRVIVGRPSGADPVQPSARAPSSVELDPRTVEPTAQPSAAPTPARGAPPPVATPPRDGSTPLVPPAGSASATRGGALPAAEPTIVVGAGQSLSTVCQSQYGTSRPDVVQALARYNGLKDVNVVRAGDTLRVPPLDRLMAQGR